MKIKTIKHTIIAIFFTQFAVALADLYGTTHNIFRLNGTYLIYMLVAFVAFWLAAVYSLATLKYRGKILAVAAVVVGFICFFAYSFFIGISAISSSREIQNSNYILEAEMYYYKVWERRTFYDKMIGGKSSKLFFSPYSKIGLVLYFEAKILKDEPERIILDIKSSFNRRATDTLKVSR